MPVQSCTSGGQPGFKWGDAGKCYTYAPGNESSRARARRRAERQGAAIEATKADITVQDVPTVNPEQGGGGFRRRKPLADLSTEQRRRIFGKGDPEPQSGRITKVDQWRQIVYAEVYVPDIPDAHGDFMKAETIEEMAHGFLKNGLTRNVDKEHDNVPTGSYVVESFVARKGDPDFVAGAWVAAVKIEDPELWQAVLDGEINGFSFEGLGKSKPAIVEIEVKEKLAGKTDDLVGHSHDFILKFDPETGDFLGGETSPGPDGHTHAIKKGTVTEDAGTPKHNHRFSYIEEVV